MTYRMTFLLVGAVDPTSIPITCFSVSFLMCSMTLWSTSWNSV